MAFHRCLFFSFAKDVKIAFTEEKKIVYLLLISGLRNETKLVKILHI